jgi:FADH2 O2-dependent halogenase
MSDFDVAIVGSGFAGSILASCLERLGLRVLLIEKARHPRFAIGESSTPLAALSLERLADRWELPELRSLAAWGRWQASHPDLGCGLKRGFTFFAQRRGERFVADPENANRLLVAASPNDAVADVHWMRSDVDRHLAELAVARGVELVEETELVGVETHGAGFRLELRGVDRTRKIAARSVIDGSGPAGAVAGQLGVGRSPVGIRSSLVYAHFHDVPDFAEVVANGGTKLSPGPYPDDRAAVHHLLDEGWIYLLPFANGVVSGGLVTVREPGSRRATAVGEGQAAHETWGRCLDRYPSLADQLAGAEPLFPPRSIETLQWKRERAAGPAWALLPHTFAFFDPLFSTGIAWSLLAVERLAGAYAGAIGSGGLDASRLVAPFELYGDLVAREAVRIEELVRGAYLAFGDFASFVELSYLYFAVVSFAETEQRLLGVGDRGAAWRGFLASDDDSVREALEGAVTRLERMRDLAPSARPAARAELAAFVARAVEPYNVTGLADPSRRRLYPVDLDLLVERAGLLGLSPAEMRRRLPDLLR